MSDRPDSIDVDAAINAFYEAVRDATLWREVPYPSLFPAAERLVQDEIFKADKNVGKTRDDLRKLIAKLREQPALGKGAGSD